MASVCSQSSYLARSSCFDRVAVAGASVNKLHLGCDGVLFERKLGLSDNLCLSRLKDRRSIAHHVSTRSRLLVFSIRCDGSHESKSSSEVIHDQLVGSPNFSTKALVEAESSNSFEEQPLHTKVGGGNNNGNGNNGGFGDDGGQDDDGGEDDFTEIDKEFGRLLNSDEVNTQVRGRGATLPPDMAEAARTLGIRSLVLSRFLDLQAAKWPLGAAICSSHVFRNRMLADQSFLFKLLTEIAIDAGCATVAEVQKRGDDFWNEFELYMADLVVGVVVDAALVSMLAPFIQFGKPATATGAMAGFSRAIQSLPSSVFEAATPGRSFSVQQRVASYFYKGIQYGAVGFSCGIIGQGIANSIMLLRRKVKKSESDVPVPPLMRSAALWGVFLAVSSNTRYQVVNGLERVVEGSALAKRLPVVAMAFTVCIRFANNTYGGMQFVDWARWSGVQ